jgi:hypothetical protein
MNLSRILPCGIQFLYLRFVFNYNHWVRVCYFIPLVRVSFINVGSGFFIKKNMNFSFLKQVIQYCLLGLKSVSVEVCINKTHSNKLHLHYRTTTHPSRDLVK